MTWLQAFLLQQSMSAANLARVLGYSPDRIRRMARGDVKTPHIVQLACNWIAHEAGRSEHMAEQRAYGRCAVIADNVARAIGSRPEGEPGPAAVALGLSATFRRLRDAMPDQIEEAEADQPPQEMKRIREEPGSSHLHESEAVNRTMHCYEASD